MKFVALAVLAVGLLSTPLYALDSQPSTENQPQMSTTTTTSQNAGEAFLAENKLKPGVITLPDGLQYKVLTAGSGAHPTDNNSVTVNYEGKLVNGTVFDSSYKRGQPITFPVTGVIPGWVEALKLMNPGATWELYIPAALAYGAQGAPPVIGPNEVLIFKVNLIAINK